MLDKTDLVQTKKQIKEMYLQNLLAEKNNKDQELIKEKIDPVIQAYLKDQLTEYLDSLEVMPGFEGVKDLFRIRRHKEKSSKANSKKNTSQDESKSKKKKKSSQQEYSKKLSVTEDGHNSVAKKSNFILLANKTDKVGSVEAQISARLDAQMASIFKKKLSGRRIPYDLMTLKKDAIKSERPFYTKKQSENNFDVQSLKKSKEETSVDPNRVSSPRKQSLNIAKPKLGSLMSFDSIERSHHVATLLKPPVQLSPKMGSDSVTSFNRFVNSNHHTMMPSLVNSKRTIMNNSSRLISLELDEPSKTPKGNTRIKIEDADDLIYHPSHPTANKFSGIVLPIPKQNMKKSDGNLLMTGIDSQAQLSKKPWFKEEDVGKKEESTHFRTEEPTGFAPSTEKTKNQTSKAKGLVHHSLKPTISVSSPSDFINIESSVMQSIGQHDKIRIKETEVSDFRISKYRFGRNNSMYQSFAPPSNNIDRLGHSSKNTKDFMDTEATISQGKHLRVNSDFVSARTKFEDFLKTDTFSKVYKNDTYRLLKIQHKLLI